MTITQTVEIPVNRKLIIDLPPEIPTGKAKMEYTIIPFEKAKPRMTEEEEIEWINKNIEWLNKEAMVNLSYQMPLWDDEDK